MPQKNILFFIFLVNVILIFAEDSIREKCKCSRAQSILISDSVCQNLCASVHYGYGPKYIYQSLCVADGCELKNIEMMRLFPGCKNAYATNYADNLVYADLCQGLCYELISDTSYPPEWRNPAQIAECLGTDGLIRCYKKYHRYNDDVFCDFHDA